jgi:hypothetical protein
MSTTVYNRQRSSPLRTNKSPSRSKGSQRRLPNNSRYDQYSGAGSTTDYEDKAASTSDAHTPTKVTTSSKFDCSKQIHDNLRESQESIVQTYRVKLEAKCAELEKEENLKTRAEIVIRKEQSIKEFKEKLKELFQKRQELCEKEERSSQATKALKDLLSQVDTNVDTNQITKQKNEEESLRREVCELKCAIITNESSLILQDPDLTPKNSGSACCIM